MRRIALLLFAVNALGQQQPVPAPVGNEEFQRAVFIARKFFDMKPVSGENLAYRYSIEFQADLRLNDLDRDV